MAATHLQIKPGKVQHEYWLHKKLETMKTNYQIGKIHPGRLASAWLNEAHIQVTRIVQQVVNNQQA